MFCLAGFLRRYVVSVVAIGCLPLVVLVLSSALHADMPGRNATTSSKAAPSVGYYTLEQARHGEQLYTQYCASCHGANLEGLSGPPLAGETFRRDVEFNKITAAQLFGFISTQMPYDRPGRLTKQEYELIFSYLLYRNNFPAGNVPLSAATIDRVNLLPFPNDSVSRPEK